MSKIGKKPIKIPEEAEMTILGDLIHIHGPKGQSSLKIFPEIKVRVEEGMVSLEKIRDDKKLLALHGLLRQKIKNALIGVTLGFRKTLELVGMGYRASLSGDTLTLSVGFSHPVEVKAPEGIVFSVDQNKITVEGSDPQLVGQVAQNIRKIRPPEPYKGKGIRYEGEVIKTKPGKAAKVGLGAPGKVE